MISWKTADFQEPAASAGAVQMTLEPKFIEPAAYSINRMANQPFLGTMSGRWKPPHEVFVVALLNVDGEFIGVHESSETLTLLLRHNAALELAGELECMALELDELRRRANATIQILRDQVSARVEHRIGDKGPADRIAVAIPCAQAKDVIAQEAAGELRLTLSPAEAVELATALKYATVRARVERSLLLTAQLRP